MRLRCGAGAALRTASNVVYVDGGRGEVAGNNVRNVQVMTDQVMLSRGVKLLKT